MQKRTHLIFAFLLFAVMNFLLHFPIYIALFALIGALIPDLDLGFMHRKIFHNVWFLLLLLIAGFRLGLIDNMVAVVIAIGFASHLIMDSLTPVGIMPLWPITKPRFRGPISTGSSKEFIIMLILAFVILSVFGVVSINL